MYCEKCGKEISENETICSNCGNKVETIDPPQEVEKKELGILSILGFILVLVPGITSLILYIFFWYKFECFNIVTFNNSKGRRLHLCGHFSCDI